MSSIAARVHHDPAEIALIESRITELDDEAKVEVGLSDGRKLRGTVTARPTVQLFRDAQGVEGVNSLLRLDDLDHPGQSHYLWLDQVQQITRIGSA